MFYQHPNYIPEKTDSKQVIKEAFYNRKQFDIAIIVLKTAIDWEKYGKKEGVHEFMLNTICLPKFEVFLPVNFGGLKWQPFMVGE